MTLRHLELKNFRCFVAASIRLNDPLVVLIGENDSGKTTILDAVELLVGRQRHVSRDDFSRLASDTADRIEITGEFELPTAHELEARFTVDGAGLRALARRSFARDDRSSTLEMLGLAFEDARFENFGKKSGDDKDALASLGLEPGSNAEKRQAQFDAAVAAGSVPLTKRWIPVDQARLDMALPEIRRVSSSAYVDPIRRVEELVQTAVRDRLQKYRAANPDAFEHAQAEADQAVTELRTALAPHLKNTLATFTQLELSAKADFLRPSISSDIRVDLGGGPRSLSELGYGSRRRSWMALEHYASKQGAGSHPSVRLYDEPDTNLHYEAQRTLFRSIRELSDADALSTTIVCTHAVTLIDSVRPHALRVIRTNGGAGHTIEALTDNLEHHMLDVVADVGRELGLSNLALLYERAFLVVEGETEEKAVPLLYKTVFRSRMEDDGIRLVNLKTCGSWKSVIQVLLAARSSMLHLLLDADCNASESTANLNPQTLSELGLSGGSVTFIGSKEFEDAFGDEVWCRVLDVSYPKDGAKWSAVDIAELRARPKFSEELRKLVLNTCRKEYRPAARKPQIGAALGRHCEKQDVPQTLLSVFDRLRTIAGLQ